MAKLHTAASTASKPYISDSDESDLELEKDYLSTAPSSNYKEFQNSKHFHKLSDSSLKKKQLILIKAPKDFDFSKMKSIPLDNNKGGDFSTVLDDVKESKRSLGKQYYIKKDTLVNTRNIKVMSLSKDKYLKIKGDLQIKDVYSINSGVEIPKIQLDQVKTPREDVVKVEGLKMEHFATGYDASDFAEANVSSSIKTSSKKENKPKKVDESSSRKDKKDKKDKKE
ncbi:hypothetical protein ACO0RG_001357 [Hanseniaspora osmophila]